MGLFLNTSIFFSKMCSLLCTAGRNPQGDGKRLAEGGRHSRLRDGYPMGMYQTCGFSTDYFLNIYITECVMIKWDIELTAWYLGVSEHGGIFTPLNSDSTSGFSVANFKMKPCTLPWESCAGTFCLFLDSLGEHSLLTKNDTSTALLRECSQNAWILRDA